MNRILLIEDNADLAFGLKTALEMDDHEVLHAATGAHGLTIAHDKAPDLIVLDLMLPDLNGMDILRRLRHAEISIPVLILTARGEEADKVLGFRHGADDYVVKPVGILELQARVAALLRRTRPAPTSVSYRDEIELNRVQRTVRLAGREIDLSPLEFDLLDALMRQEGAFMTRAELLRQVWGYRADVASRTVDTHIAKLRSKLRTDGVERIITVRKRGYRVR